MITHLVGFLRREDAGTNRLSDFLHIISECLLLQSLVRLALTWIVLDRLLQAARAACVDTGTTFNCFRTSSCMTIFFFYLARLAAAGVTIIADLNFTICFRLFESDFQTRPPAV